MLNNIQLYQKDKPFLFFPNYNLGKKQKDKYDCTNINDFLRVCSFYITWIGAFGFWENELLLVDDWFGGCETSLWQAKVLLEILSKKNKIVVLNEQKVSVQEVKKKDISYGLYNVFYKNYLKLISDKVESGVVDQSCYNFLRKDILLNFFSIWVVNHKLNKQKYRMSTCEENLEDLVAAEYKNESYFIFYFCKVRFLLYKQKLKELIRARGYLTCRVGVVD